MIKCPGCQKELDDGAKFCTCCGMSLKPQTPVNNANQPAQAEQPKTSVPLNNAAPQNTAVPQNPMQQTVPQNPAQQTAQTNPMQPKAPQTASPRMESLPPQNNVNRQYSQSAPQGQPAGQNGANGYQAPPPFYGQNQTPPPYYGQPQQQYQAPYGMPQNMGDNTPLGVAQYVIMMILQAIPLVGLIAMIIWAIGGQGSNVNRRNYARAYLVIQVISIVLSLLAGVVFAAFLPSIASFLEELSYALI